MLRPETASYIWEMYDFSIWEINDLGTSRNTIIKKHKCWYTNCSGTSLRKGLLSFSFTYFVDSHILLWDSMNVCR